MNAMKISRLFLAVFALGMMSQYVTAAPLAGPEDVLRSKILRLVQSPSSKKMGDEKVVAHLRLYVNHDKEVVVLDTGTENQYLDDFIKRRLNYRVLADNETTKGIYNFKITFVSKQ